MGKLRQLFRARVINVLLKAGASLVPAHFPSKPKSRCQQLLQEHHQTALFCAGTEVFGLL